MTNKNKLLITDDANRGEDGSKISAEDVRDKIKELEGKERLSVFDLKDTEWLNRSAQMNWSSAGFSVVHDNTLIGNGSQGSPLSVIGSGAPSGANRSIQFNNAGVFGGLPIGGPNQVLAVNGAANGYTFVPITGANMASFLSKTTVDLTGVGGAIYTIPNGKTLYISQVVVVLTDLTAFVSNPTFEVDGTGVNGLGANSFVPSVASDLGNNGLPGKTSTFLPSTNAGVLYDQNTTIDLVITVPGVAATFVADFYLYGLLI